MRTILIVGIVAAGILVFSVLVGAVLGAISAKHEVKVAANWKPVPRGRLGVIRGDARPRKRGN